MGPSNGPYGGYATRRNQENHYSIRHPRSSPSVWSPRFRHLESSFCLGRLGRPADMWKLGGFSPRFTHVGSPAQVEHMHNHAYGVYTLIYFGIGRTISIRFYTVYLSAVSHAPCRRYVLDFYKVC